MARQPGENKNAGRTAAEQTAQSAMHTGMLRMTPEGKLQS